MFQKRTNEQGFTLIELMIVIAIIGILAAIAIPNFISYRNKSYCSAAETDANTVAGKIANYFSIATHTGVPAASDLGAVASSLSNSNTATVNGTDPNGTISIAVTDATGRCPTDYKAGLASSNSPTGYWSAATTAGHYVKVIQP
jgi:prepilin-type N-terminal cleavage/methylation domain-containing protein